MTEALERILKKLPVEGLTILVKTDQDKAEDPEGMITGDQVRQAKQELERLKDHVSNSNPNSSTSDSRP